MFLAGVNFTLMWLFGAGDFKAALKDEEFRTYLLYITAASGDCHFARPRRHGLGSCASRYPLPRAFNRYVNGLCFGQLRRLARCARIILLLLMIVGACAGSTSGGLKLMRIRIGLKVAFRELARIAQPRKIHMIRMNKEVVEDKQVSLVVGMLFIWVILFGFSCIVLGMMMPDASFETIFSVAASGLGN